MNYLQTSELWNELQELQVRSAENALDDEDNDRRAALIDLFAVLGDKPTTDITLIPESEWETFTRDYAEDLAGDEAELLFGYVDWSALADSLQTDFQSVTFDGTEYLYR